MALSDRGFASMDKEKQRRIASKGGQAAHKKGTAHRFTTEEAQIAGRKGGLVTGARRSLGASPKAEETPHEELSRFSDEGNPND